MCTDRCYLLHTPACARFVLATHPSAFLPRDEFKLVLVVKTKFPPPKTAAKCHIIEMDTGEDAEAEAAESGGDQVAAAFGIKEIKRNSEEMVEDAFEGDLDAVKDWLEKGVYIDSMDQRKHTALSEAACNGATELVQFLLDQVRVQRKSKVHA